MTGLACVRCGNGFNVNDETMGTLKSIVIPFIICSHYVPDPAFGGTSELQFLFWRHSEPHIAACWVVASRSFHSTTSKGLQNKTSPLLTTDTQLNVSVCLTAFSFVRYLFLPHDLFWSNISFQISKPLFPLSYYNYFTTQLILIYFPWFNRIVIICMPLNTIL